MKKILSVFLVLAMASVASAASVWFVVDPLDAKDHYTPSDIIKINVLADFEVRGFNVMAMVANDGTAENNAQEDGLGLHPNFLQEPEKNGTIMNTPLDGGVLLIYDISGTVPYGAPLVPVEAVLYSFEFHVPYVDDSTWITIDDYTDNSALPPIYTTVFDAYYVINISDIGPAMIHVIPEPITIVLLGLGALFLRRRK